MVLLKMYAGIEKTKIFSDQLEMIESLEFGTSDSQNLFTLLNAIQRKY